MKKRKVESERQLKNRKSNEFYIEKLRSIENNHKPLLKSTTMGYMSSEYAWNISIGRALLPFLAPQLNIKHLPTDFLRVGVTGGSLRVETQVGC